MSGERMDFTIKSNPENAAEAFISSQEALTARQAQNLEDQVCAKRCAFYAENWISPLTRDIRCPGLGCAENDHHVVVRLTHRGNIVLRRFAQIAACHPQVKR